ncbi:hypothetical protein Hanom_Chr11g01048851 [Helianthus anomalus]
MSSETSSTSSKYKTQNPSSLLHILSRPPLLLHLQPPPRRAPPSPAAPTLPSTLSSSRSTSISTPSSHRTADLNPFHSRPHRIPLPPLTPLPVILHLFEI